MGRIGLKHEIWVARATAGDIMNRNDFGARFAPMASNSAASAG